MKKDTKRSAEEAIDTLINGNISDFKKWLKRTSKKDLLNAVEYYGNNYGKRYIIIKIIISYLEDIDL